MSTYKLKNMTIEGKTYVAAMITVNNADAYEVEHIFSPNSKYLKEWSDSAPIKQGGYELLATINAGAFIKELNSDGTRCPLGICVSNGVKVPTDIELANDKVQDFACDYSGFTSIDYKDSTDIKSYKILRSGYEFSLEKINGQWIKSIRTDQEGVYNESALRTIVAYKRDGISFMMFSTAITGNLIGIFLDNLNEDYYKVINMDGGASAGYIIKGEKDFGIKPFREVHEVFYIYRRSADPLPPIDPPVDPEPPVDPSYPTTNPSGVYMYVRNTGAHLRLTPVNGEPQITVPVNGQIKVLELPEEKQSDRYRWGKGSYNGVTGYFQYDPQVMHPIGVVTSPSFTMQLTDSGAYLRDAMMGNKLTLLPKGSTIQIKEFMLNRQADDFFWCRTVYNGNSAFFQYDPALMMPVTGSGTTPPIDPPVTQGVQMVLTGLGARLRSDIPNGTILTTIPNGTTFPVAGLYNWKATDGYRWGWGEYNGSAGYFQYDPEVMHPVGTTDGTYTMWLTGLAANIRSSVQGTILTTAPKGASIKILEFLGTKASDGYYWCRGTYNGVTGYFQYDPKVMFPTNDGGTPPIDPEPPVVQKGVKMVLTGLAARLRTDMPSGTILTTIPNGSTFDVVGLYSWNASDGYKWGWGKYGGYEGYFQYDPKVMHPIGIPEDDRYKMVLVSSAARIRATVGGTILTTVPNGSQIKILEFLEQKHSDGYYWCRGTYGSVTGYFQYDSALMYPTND